MREGFHTIGVGARSSAGRVRARVVAGLLVVGLGLWLLAERHFGKFDYLIVSSESMEPTLSINDRVLMEKEASYKTGDIVVVVEPSRHDILIVKRIVATEGQVVSTRGETVTVGATPGESAPDKQWTVGRGEVFLLGDNRVYSRDSREYGPVPVSAIRGVVRYRKDSLLHWTAVK